MKYFYGKNRKEAAEKLSAYINESKKGTYIEPSKYTVSRWLDDGYNNYVANRVKPSTRARYDTCIRVHIKPNYGIIIKNPAAERRVSLPQSTIKEPLKVFTLEEQKAIEKECSTERLGTAILLDLYTGLRRGELLALTWEDLDFEKRTITINKQLARLRNFDKNATTKTVITLSPYTKTSEDRTISVAKDILNLLKAFKEKEIADGISQASDKDLIFGDEKGGYLNPRKLVYAYERILKRANVGYRKFHALRHTFATRALELNIPIKVVSKILGHANTRITLDIYSHVLPECQDEAMQTITDKLLAV